MLLGVTVVFVPHLAQGPCPVPCFLHHSPFASWKRGQEVKRRELEDLGSEL